MKQQINLMYKKAKFIISCLTILAAPAFVAAQTYEQPIIKVLNGAFRNGANQLVNQIKKDSSIQVDDALRFSADSSKLKLTGYYRIKNIISLKLNEDTNVVYKPQFTVTVMVKLFLYNRFGDVDSSRTPLLTIAYDSARAAANMLQSTITLYDAYRVNVKIISVDSSYMPANVSPMPAVTPFVRIENEMQIAREYNFSCNDALTGGIATDLSALSATGEAIITWPAKQGAAEYDMEWTFIDDEALLDTCLYKTAGNLDAKKIFRNNATRVTTTATTYTIPMIFDEQGTIFVRYRPVQVRPNQQRYEGRWSTDTTATAGLGQIVTNGGHEPLLNWQATTSFAEEGKRKSVVQYYDGSLRQRQTVTKDNSTNTTVVAETFYDLQGRPVIQVLPAPTLSTIISYSKNFNRSINAAAPYEKNLYDTIINASDYCLTPAPAMGTDSGAAKYYSSNNPQAAIGFNKFIPNAQGYAFTETRYTQDNTGRVLAQSGVGSSFKIGSGHETKYFYSNPSQPELDGLFGTEVGYASHYTKTAVRDANGQYSVSYTDMHGRTIATALAGKAPAALDSIASYNKRNIMERLSDSTNNIVYDKIMESSRTLLVTDSGLHSFTYALNVDSIRINSCTNKTICYDCLYDLEISITDECNNCHLPGNQPYVVKKSNFTLANIDTTCNAPKLVDTTFSIALPEGNYTITKKLSVSQYGINYLRDSVFMKLNTCKTFADFYKEEMDSIKSQINCQPQSCDSCTYYTSSLATFRLFYLQQAKIPYADSASVRDEINLAYTEAKEECNLICGKAGEVTFLRRLLLDDMTAPVGQYANPDSANISGSQSNFNIFKNSTQTWRTVTYTDAYGKADSIINSTGILVPPTDATITQDDFLNNFKQEWANNLLPLHPEYQKLLEYEKHTASSLWDAAFESIDTYREADSLGYLNPVSLTGSQVPSHFNYVAANVDPLAKTDSLLYTSLPGLVYNYKTNGTYTFSMWGIASIAGKCNNDACGGNYTNSTINNNINPGTFCTGELDMAWRSFSSSYLAAKRTAIMQALHAQFPSVRPGIPANRIEHFAESNATLSSINTTIGTPSQSGTLATANTQMQQVYKTTCEGYAASWWQALAPCNLTVADSTNLIGRMVQICVAGSDGNHPFGSSSTAPGSTLPYTSFEALVKHYIDSMNVLYPTQYAWDTSCNVYTIYHPAAYDNQTGIANIPIWTKPDTCQCNTITSYYNNYLLAYPSGDTTTFATYILKKTGTVMANADLTKLRNLCSGIDTCKFLASPITLPPAMQCGVKDVCIECVKMQQVLDTFKIAFPNQYPVYDATDSIQERINRNFTNFANYKLGFTKTAVDYLLFMDTCKINYGAPYTKLFNCDTLTDVQTKFISTVYPNLVWPKTYDADSCVTNVWTTTGSLGTPVIANGTIKFKDLFTLTGVVSLPDAVADTLKQSALRRMEFSTASICNVNGITLETRMALPNFASANTLADVKYLLFGIKYNKDIANNIAQNIFFTPTNVQFSGTYSYPAALQPFDISQYHTYKLQYKTDSLKIFVDDVLIVALYNQGNLIKVNNWSHQIRDLRAKIDYCKATAGTGVVALDEPFNSGCGTFANIALPFVCSVPNCQTSFVNYFNQRMGGTRTYATIDTIYSRQCGKFINPCNSDNRPTLCGKTEPLFPEITIEEESPCADSSDLAFVLATEKYRVYQDSLKNAFENRYLQRCMQAFKTESFTVTHPQSIYHYTLYYYDQAGNLVKTIPPQGTNLTAQYRTTWLDSVATARRNNQPLTPNHQLQTNYRYNTLNQVVQQQSPDGGESNFYYDRLGRLVISQNAKQKANSATENNRHYSYTKYDALGRITEVGQLKNATTTPATQAITQDVAAFNTWLTNATATNANIEMVTRTFYDKKYTALIGPPRFSAVNLRNRVAYTTYTEGNSTANYNNATFYSYDVHGNVDTLIQDYGSSQLTATANIMNSNTSRWKRMVYRYDLISGKVNHVAYQPNYTDSLTGQIIQSQDAVYHRYMYDAENRITQVQTSTDSTTWQTDARYQYYKHGPLARMVLGQRQVQGVDYAYTLQGWLKGVNSSTLSTTFDMGADGTTWQSVARDAYGYNLNYYNGDYTNISSTNTFAGIGILPTADIRNLYNGNITSMAVNISKFNSTAGAAGDSALLYNYKYDQLNRLVSMDAFRGLNTSTNTWNSSLTKLTAYRERISYDANGNILTYRRNGHLSATPVMDSMNYSYNANTNQLNRVQDLANTNTAYADDIDDNQFANNYTYDAIGNLITDSSENIRATVGGIKWNVYGKITEINKVDSTAANPYNKGRIKKITYGYDAAGNRISKKVERYTNAVVNYTWYVRDASGNVMSTYAYTSTNATDISANKLLQNEVYLYGSSRLGSYTVNKDVEVTQQTSDTAYTAYGDKPVVKTPFIVGLKQYELTNHLGNVLATISDKKTPVDANSDGVIDYYAADVITANDYYPFGMQMNGRRYSAGSAYRFGFNGKENDKEAGEGMQDYGMRIYDGRIGKFLSVDPLAKSFAWNSPYSYAEGDVIRSIDLDGLEKFIVTEKEIINVGQTMNVEKVWNVSLDMDYKLPADQVKAGITFAVQWPDGSTHFGVFNDNLLNYTFGRSSVNSTGEMVINSNPEMAENPAVNKIINTEKYKSLDNTVFTASTKNYRNSGVAPSSVETSKESPKAGKTCLTTITVHVVDKIVEIPAERQAGDFGGNKTGVATAKFVTPSVSSSPVQVTVNTDHYEIPNNFTIKNASLSTPRRIINRGTTTFSAKPGSTTYVNVTGYKNAANGKADAYEVTVTGTTTKAIAVEKPIIKCDDE